MPAQGELQLETSSAVVEDFISDGASNGVASDDDDHHTTRKLGNASPAPSADCNGFRSSKWFASLPVKEEHDQFFRDAVDLLLEKAVFQGTSRNNKVLEWRNPEDMMKILDLELKNTPSDHDELFKLMNDTIKYSVKTGHPYFVNQLFSAVDPYGLVGQWMGDALNPSVYTYEVSPVFSLMEETVLKEMRKIVGWEHGHGDGIFCPGGSIANGYAISCARYHRVPDVKTQGLHGLPRLVVYTSEDAHYSIKKMGSFLGIGSDNVYLIKTDSVGKMNPIDLEAQIKRTQAEGALPLIVCATAGTTVFGAFDPILEIADICEQYGIWLHVDAAWGGGALVSDKHRHLLRGIERADSVTWNPHKLLTAPQQCSTFLLRHEGVLANAHSASAQYLFQKDKFYDTSFDTGDKHIQCGRRADVLKFWFMWKAKGTIGFERHVDTVFENASFFTETIRNRPGFKLVLEQPECTNVCFWYIPPSLRGCEHHSDYKEKLHRVAPKIKERMMREGAMMVTYQPQGNLPNFFRLVLQNSGLDREDMIHFVHEFERLGHDL